MTDDRDLTPAEQSKPGKPALPKGTVFPTHRRYRFFFVASVVLTLLFSWDLVRGVGGASIFFLGIALLVALWTARLMVSRVELTPAGITLHAPLTPSRHVDFRQLVSASQEGRRNQVITLIYYPIADDGLLDLHNVRTIFLPAVVEQERLLAIIQREMPAP